MMAADIQTSHSHNKNNFDFIRLFAAFLVLVSHSYPLHFGNSRLDPLLAYNGQFSMGTLAVYLFFSLSGFLITESYTRDPSAQIFLLKRTLRIFPGFVVAVLFAGLVLGPLVSKFTMVEYFSDPAFMKYFKNLLLYPITYDLPGVFVENIYGRAVNGSLWSIPIEFTMYLAVLFLGIRKWLSIKSITYFALIIIAAGLFLPEEILKKYVLYMNVGEILKCGSFFAVGMLLNRLPDPKSFLESNRTFLISAMGLLLALVLSPYFSYNLLLLISLPLFTLSFGYSKKIRLSEFGKFGDFSYGVYLYAFPIQQTVQFYLANRVSVVQFMILSACITLLLAIFSWYLVEKPSQRMRARLFAYSH